MRSRVTTIITNDVDMSTFEPDVSLSIDGGDLGAVSSDAMWSAVVGSIQATIITLHEVRPEAVERMLRFVAKHLDLDLAEPEEGFVGPSEG